MCDHAHPCYLDHSRQERLKPLNQDFHDEDPTLNHAFLDPAYSSIFF